MSIETPATPDQIAKAREMYAESNDIEIDDDAKISEGSSGNWIQAWVWMPEGDE